VAESTLSIDYDDLQLEIGRFLGYDATVGNWAAAQTAEVDRYIQAGVRQFYYPPAVQGIEAGFEWSFLKPTTTLETESVYDTGSLAVVSTDCTLTGGVWPSWAATHGTLTINDTVYVITTRDDDTGLTVVGSDDTAANGSWSLGHAGYQDMPDDFGRVIGDLHYEADIYAHSITQVSEHRIQTLLQQDDTTNPPKHFATRYKTSDLSTGQRHEIIFWPKPDDDYTLTYRCEAYSGKIATTQYPLGGMKYAEVIIESCLAVAEQRANDEKGLHWDSFVRTLTSAIEFDRASGARYFGAMSSGERVRSDPRDRRLQGSSYDITYKGTTW